MKNKIVLVEDEPDFARTCSKRLTHAGYQVYIASSGLKALNLIHKEKPDLVLLDLHIPEMDGIEVCKNIKSKLSLQDIPVLFLTADSNNIEEKVKLCKAQGYILKPYDSVNFLNLVGNYACSKQ